jgi:alkaline phosphatase
LNSFFSYPLVSWRKFFILQKNSGYTAGFILFQGVNTNSAARPEQKQKENMKPVTLSAILLGAACGWSHLCAEDDAPARTAQVLHEYTLGSFDVSNFGLTPAEIADGQANGLTRIDLPAIGSGLQRLAGNNYVSITDRGPTFTRTTPTPGRVFPLPNYTPSLVFFQAIGDQILPHTVIGIVVDDAGTPATGIPNSATEDSVPFASPTATTPLSYNPNGMDIEDLHTLPDGNFIVVDEYSPSIAIISDAGKVLKRYTPHGKTLAGAAYPVADTLPAILAQRRSNRGFESIAVSGDGQTAYTMTQSPLGPTSSGSPTRNSRILRILRLDVTDPLNLQVTGQFLVQLSPASAYPAGNRPQDLKVSAAAWVNDDKLLILERSDEVNIGGAKLILVDLASATDVSGLPQAQTLALEDSSLVLSTLGITPAATSVVYENGETPEITDFKLEGLSILNSNDVAISNDNDFGIVDAGTGNPSRMWIIRLRDRLPRNR